MRGGSNHCYNSIASVSHQSRSMEESVASFHLGEFKAVDSQKAWPPLAKHHFYRLGWRKMCHHRLRGHQEIFWWSLVGRLHDLYTAVWSVAAGCARCSQPSRCAHGSWLFARQAQGHAQARRALHLSWRCCKKWQTCNNNQFSGNQCIGEKPLVLKNQSSTSVQQ